MRPRRLIRIVNKTIWQTRDLRRFVTRAARQQLRGEYDKYVRGKFLTVYFRPSSQHPNRGRRNDGRVHGQAQYFGPSVWIFIPPTFAKNKAHRLELAAVLHHEFGHTRGLTHRDMIHLYNRDWERDFRWAVDLPLEQYPPRSRKCAASLRDDRLKNARAKRAEWARKKKLATTKLAVWEQKVRALEPN